MDKDKTTINPHNMMPVESQLYTDEASKILSKDRMISGIQKSSNTTEKWEYPSPLQFYNALKRKGKDAPAESIETMVDIHNFLNEGSWQEILQWERKYHCDCQDIGLLKFQGKPTELSPKAWFYTTFYGADKPFDRHDWTIDRCGQTQRYIIDYYGGTDSDNAASFNVDVRPALDNPQAIYDRLRDGFSSLFDRFK
ncbi:cytochrome c/c1 heme-lyase [Globomyces pollinis-pini]|nr:cytochrome c/c1 heme-lyase [Globomyces pollinis-pini]